MRSSFSRSPCSILSTGMPVQRETICATWSAVTVSSTIEPLPSLRLSFLELALQFRDTAIGELAGPLELALALGDGEFVARLVDLPLEVGGKPQLFLLGTPGRGDRSGLLLEVGQLLLDALQPILRRLVLLDLQRLALDLELHDAAIDLVERLRLGIDLHPEPRRGLVDKVDRLVGQEAVGDVAGGQRRGGNQRRIRKCAPCDAARTSP